MSLVKLGQITPDRWHFVTDHELGADNADIVVSRSCWLSERVHLTTRSGRLGVVLQSDEAIEDIVADIADLDLIVLNFDEFTDGRHYSNAFLLRQRYGYTGELRASGMILPDQREQLVRCGFDALLVEDRHDTHFVMASSDFSFVYQYAADTRKPAYRLRHVLS